MVALLSHGWIALVARLALALPFLVSGVLKLSDFAGAQAEVAALSGLTGAAGMLAAAAVVATQLGGSALLIAGGRFVWIGAGLLAGFTLAATLVAHAFWTMEGPDRMRNMMVFFEHAAICGGLLLVAHLSARAGRGTW